MKRIYIVLVALFLVNGAMGQSCLPEGITFTRQAQIDSFPIIYPSCTQIEGNVIFRGYDITNLNGLSDLTSIGGSLIFGVYIYLLGEFGNPNLTSLTGLENLISIGGNLEINYNDALTSLTGLENVNTIGGYLNIFDNVTLTSLEGLDNINAGSITNIGIRKNNILTTCAVQSVCDYLSNPNGIVNISENAIGCNNPPEIASNCGITLPCLPYGNYHFITQTQIDSFQINYPNCTALEGDVTIIGNDITNINGLTDVTSIGGKLLISNTLLSDISALNDLISIGTNLDIEDNESLTSLTGLEGLTSLGGNLTIYHNDALTCLTGLENITSILGYTVIAENYVLASLGGLEELTSIGGELCLSGNAFTNLMGLENIASIGGNLVINTNVSLISLDGLKNLSSIGGYLLIGGNGSLTSLSGLDNIDAGTITFLLIQNNYALSTCEVQSVCDYLARPNVPCTISSNTAGCNTKDEVEAACAALPVDDKTNDIVFTMYPNPASTVVTIESTTIGNLSILNLSGQQIFTHQITEPKTQLDISTLSSGFYFLRLTNDKSVEVGKIIKQ